MNLCPNCAAELIPGAKFCHRCGDKVVEKSKSCPACQEQNPLASVFCHHCGFHFEGKQHRERVYEPQYRFDFNSDNVADQVKALFFKNLRNRVEEEHDIGRYSDYVERFYHSRFLDIYTVRAEQVAEDIHIQWERFGQEAFPEIDRRIAHAFEGLLDYFIIQYCPDLNGMRLPEAILRYEQLQSGKTDLGVMVHDFLDFEFEDEVVYVDFVAMPEHLLANACKQFLFAGRKEKVFFIADLSLKGNCKEGFAMTDQGIYWRMPFDKPRQVAYTELREIKKNKELLTINGHFFTANRSLNLKLFKLLKKLKGWRTVHATSFA